jgi:hypothetical protein
MDEKTQKVTRPSANNNPDFRESLQAIDTNDGAITSPALPSPRNTLKTHRINPSRKYIARDGLILR